MARNYDILYSFNELHTPFNPDSESDQEYVNFMEQCLNDIQFIKNLTSKNRPRLKDLERIDFEYEVTDDTGKTTGEIRIENKIDPHLTNPHILEDMDYFRQAAIHFEEHGCYTTLTPNSHPKSAYARFWMEEKRRCLEGYVRESDGEWITGYHYWYLNYSRIQKVHEIQSVEGAAQSRGERREGFPDVWDGDYWYFHYLEKAESLGMFGVVLKTRRRGFSFKGGANPARNFVLIKESNNFLLAHNDQYLSGDGIWKKAMDNLDWAAKHTPFPRLRYVNKQSDYLVRGGYKKKGSDAIFGNKTLLTGIITNDTHKARGIAGKYLAFEEAGSYPNLKDVWQIAEPSFKQGDVTFGFMVAFGTGGAEEADFAALEALFRTPESFNVYSLPNVFDTNANPDDRIGFFFPEYISRQNCYDKDGNSDVTKALKLIYHDRRMKKLDTSDAFAVVREKAERPITPVEAMMRKQGTIFPIHLLSEYLAEIRMNEAKFVAPNYAVNLFEKDGRVRWEPSQALPNRKHPVDKANKPGCVELFYLPAKNAAGDVQENRYIIGVDTYDDDVSTTDSLGSCIVFDMFTETIVAEYTGRPAFASEFYEICRMLAIMYNAKINYENNKKGLFGHFQSKKALHLLARTPDYLYQKDLLKTKGHGNTAYGTPATLAVNYEGIQLQAEWLASPNPMPIMIKDEEGNLIPEFVTNMEKVKSVGYIEEANKWNADDNFDRVSAMNMVMVYFKDMQNRIEQMKESRIKQKSEDPFFKKIFRKHGAYNRSFI